MSWKFERVLMKNEKVIHKKLIFSILDMKQIVPGALSMSIFRLKYLKKVRLSSLKINGRGRPMKNSYSEADVHKQLILRLRLFYGGLSITIKHDEYYSIHCDNTHLTSAYFSVANKNKVIWLVCLARLGKICI